MEFFWICMGLSGLLIVFGFVTGRLEFQNPFMIDRYDRLRTEFTEMPTRKSSDSTWTSKGSTHVVSSSDSKGKTTYTTTGDDGVDRAMTEEEVKAFDQIMNEMDDHMKELDKTLENMFK